MKLRECSLTALTRTISERCEVRVAGMTCQSCVRKITAALEAEEAVLSCEVSLETESASVEFDPDLVTAEDIELAINNVGPKVREMMHVELSLYLTIARSSPPPCTRATPPSPWTRGTESRRQPGPRPRAATGAGCGSRG